ncbi:Myb DNA-bind 5 domain-containing protein, partial [Aphis craccivora]
MLKNNNKRLRCSNFSATERVHWWNWPQNIQTCWNSKISTWLKIQEEFTATTGSTRDVQNLKDKYENLKRKAKKTEADRKRKIFKTGGGTARSTTAPSPTHNVLLDIMGTAAVGLVNIFDGDKTVNTEEEIEIVGINSLEDEFIYSYNDNSVVQHVDHLATAMDNPVAVVSSDTVVHVGHHATVMDNSVAVVTSDTVVEHTGHPEAVVTFDTVQQQH